MRVSGSVPVLSARLAPRGAITSAAKPVSAPASQTSFKATGADPLPTFGSCEAYKNYVVNLVSQAVALDRELTLARQALNQGDGFPMRVTALQDRLDAVLLQLAVLRDSYPIPEAWTRPKWLLGDGFDKEEFWRRQSEALPRKPIIKPDPEPFRPSEPGKMPPETLRRVIAANAFNIIAYGRNGSAGDAMRPKLEAILDITQGRKDDYSWRLDTIVRETLNNYDDNEAYAYWFAGYAVNHLGADYNWGTLDFRTSKAITQLSAMNEKEWNTDRLRACLRLFQTMTKLSDHRDMKAMATIAERALMEYDGDSDDDKYGLKTALESIQELNKSAWFGRQPRFGW